MKSFATIVLSICLALPSGAATITAASASYADVNTACNTTAARGDTVIVPAGTATWGSTLTLTKEITLIGAGIGNTVITRSGIAIQINPDATQLANQVGTSIWGFEFDMNGSLVCININGASALATKPFTNLFIGTNAFKNSATSSSGNGVIATGGQVRGVIAQCVFDRCNVILKLLGNDNVAEFENAAWTNTIRYGTADQLFFEDNLIQFSSSYAGDTAGWIETGQGSRVVVRYNRLAYANATAESEIWDVHGFQNFPGGGQTGTMIVEYYGNGISDFGGYRWINHRGNPGIFFNNILTGPGGASIEINQYTVGDAGGSGSEPEVPGEFLTSVRDTYVFNNTDDGTIKNMTPGSIGDGGGTAENVSWWNFNASFNGTTGIGRGTTAPTGSATAGVGYWVCSTATPTTNAAIVQTGTFYKATATDTWTPYYTPYTYPHPLRVASGVTGAPVKRGAIRGLRLRR